MKWVVLCYFLVLVLGYSVWYFFKKKSLNCKFFCFTIFGCNLFFLLFIGFLFLENYRRSEFFSAENKKLILEKEVVMGKGIESAHLEKEILNLKEDKSKFENEINDLKGIYNTLSNASFQIDDFPTFDQKKDYPNGCESIALYLMLKYYDVDVHPNQIISLLKKGDAPYIENGVKYGADPEIEFVGDPKGKSGYGVFENPIIDVANHFKSGIVKATGKSLEEVLEIVRKGRPVQVWASSYLRTPTKCNTWIHKETGKMITWYCNFHSLVLIGASKDKVIVSDPLTGTIVNYNREKFMYAYDFYGRRAIYYE